MFYSLLFTFLIGVFFLLGMIIFKYSNHKKNLTILATACAFIVILGLICFDLIPEVIEYHSWYSLIFIIIGIFILKIIDIFVPHHNHKHHDNDEATISHKRHLNHIGTITIIALILHNFIEGIGLYSIAQNNLKNGLMLVLGIGFHNLPLGIEIGSLNQDKLNIWLNILLVLSSFLGGVTSLMVGNLPDIMTNIIISLTIGMIIHILIFELLGELVNNREKKESIYGIIIGIIILIVINCL